jgi:hypothetical protein
MSHRIDARIQVIFGSAAEAGQRDALLLEGDAEAPPGAISFTPAQASGHTLGCACCAPRNPAGQALGRLMLARARGETPFFTRVVAVLSTQEGRDAVLHALSADPLASGCFRLDQNAHAGQGTHSLSQAPGHARDT